MPEHTIPSRRKFLDHSWASRMPGGSSTNVLTREGLTDLGGGGDFCDTRVRVEKV